MADSELVF